MVRQECDVSDIRTLEAARSLDGHVLSVDREADAGKEAAAESIVKDIFDAWTSDTSHGFCVGYGSISLEPSINEQARLSLEHAAFPEVKLRFETRTVQEPDLKSYADADEEKGVASASGGTATVLADRRRAVAGLEGHEIWLLGAFPGEKSTVRFTWVYPGVGGSGTQPMITVVAMAPAERQNELQSIWETVLTSLRSVPLAAGQSR